jgi:CRISPR-associated protein Cas2
MVFTVISYDISDDRKRTQVANILADHGTRVQYSVFECRIDMKTLEMLVKMLEPLPECGDSIRIYFICEGCLKKAILLGRGEFSKEEAFHIV